MPQLGAEGVLLQQPLNIFQRLFPWLSMKRLPWVLVDKLRQEKEWQCMVGSRTGHTGGGRDRTGRVSGWRDRVSSWRDRTGRVSG